MLLIVIVWDMIHDGDATFLSCPSTGAQNIAEFVEARWKKEWDYVFPKPQPGVTVEPQAMKQSIPLGDDICVGIIQFTI